MRTPVCLPRLMLSAFLGLALFANLAMATRPAHADDALIVATKRATVGLTGCETPTGRALYACIAAVLEQLAAEIAPSNIPVTQRSLQAAAAGLRNATDQPAALSAITHCQTTIAAAQRQSQATGGALVRGWGDADGIALITAVLERAARPIRAKS